MKLFNSPESSLSSVDFFAVFNLSKIWTADQLVRYPDPSTTSAEIDAVNGLELLLLSICRVFPGKGFVWMYVFLCIPVYLCVPLTINEAFPDVQAAISIGTDGLPTQTPSEMQAFQLSVDNNPDGPSSL